MIELRILRDGRVVAVADDATVALMRRLGALTVSRASHVEWDDKTARWAVYDPKMRDTGQRFKARAKALAWEREHVWTLVGLEPMRHICAAPACKPGGG